MNPSQSSRLTKIIQLDSFKDKAVYHRRMILLAEKIFGRRKDLNISQEELADKADSTQRIISQLENAEYLPENGIGIELYDKLSHAFEIDRDYLLSDKIDRRTFELFAYIGTQLNWQWDKMQFMKLPYFVDLNIATKHGFQISNFNYIRYEFGPFDKNIYVYRTLFENNKFQVKFSYIEDFLPEIKETLDSLPASNGEKLKKLSYETEPMKRLNAKLGGKEGWGQKLILNNF